MTSIAIPSFTVEAAGNRARAFQRGAGAGSEVLDVERGDSRKGATACSQAALEHRVEAPQGSPSEGPPVEVRRRGSLSSRQTFRRDRTPTTFTVTSCVGRVTRRRNRASRRRSVGHLGTVDEDSDPNGAGVDASFHEPERDLSRRRRDQGGGRRANEESRLQGESGSRSCKSHHDQREGKKDDCRREQLEGALLGSDQGLDIDLIARSVMPEDRPPYLSEVPAHVTDLGRETALRQTERKREGTGRERGQR